MKFNQNINGPTSQYITKAIDNYINNRTTDIIADNIQFAFEDAAADDNKRPAIEYALNKIIKTRGPESIALFASTVAFNNPETTAFIKEIANSINNKIWGNRENSYAIIKHKKTQTELEEIWSEGKHKTNLANTPPVKNVFDIDFS